MVRRVHLHMDLNEAAANLIKAAAKLSRVQPSYYVLNRVLRVAELEIKEWRERRAAPEAGGDIDEGSQQTVSGGSAGGSGGGDGGVAPSRDEAEEGPLEEEERTTRGSAPGSGGVPPSCAPQGIVTGWTRRPVPGPPEGRQGQGRGRLGALSCA